MSYVKQTWQTGDTVTSAKLNHMEDGIAAGGGVVLVVKPDLQAGTLDKTWQEIHDATFAVFKTTSTDGGFTEHSTYFVKETATRNGKYYVDVTNGDSGFEFVADSADGYPAPSQG